MSEREAAGWEPLWEAYRQRLAVGVVLKRGPLDQPERATLIDVERDGSARVRRDDGTFDLWASVEGENEGRKPVLMVYNQCSRPSGAGQRLKGMTLCGLAG